MVDHFFVKKNQCLVHTCDTFLSPNRDVWIFWSGNSYQISGGFHVANFGLFSRSLKVAKSSDNCRNMLPSITVLLYANRGEKICPFTI